MYENYEEDFEESVETVGASLDVPGVVHDDDRPVSVTVSGGDAGGFISGSDGFDYERFAESLSVALGGSVSDSDSGDPLSLVQEDMSETLAEINTSVQALSAVVSLIFAFLLLDWTSRKLLAVVNRFSGRRK